LAGRRAVVGSGPVGGSHRPRPGIAGGRAGAPAVLSPTAMVSGREIRVSTKYDAFWSVRSRTAMVGNRKQPVLNQYHMDNRKLTVAAPRISLSGADFRCRRTLSAQLSLCFCGLDAQLALVARGYERVRTFCSSNGRDGRRLGIGRIGRCRRGPGSAGATPAVVPGRLVGPGMGSELGLEPLPR
jgi:hypothetical protein